MKAYRVYSFPQSHEEEIFENLPQPWKQLFVVVSESSPCPWGEQFWSRKEWLPAICRLILYLEGTRVVNIQIGINQLAKHIQFDRQSPSLMINRKNLNSLTKLHYRPNRFEPDSLIA
jgi:hypothetical protein